MACKGSLGVISVAPPWPVISHRASCHPVARVVDFAYLWNTSPGQLSGTKGHGSCAACKCDTSAPFGPT